MWATEGLKVNPSAGTILADTGAVGSLLTLSVTLIAWTNTGVLVDIAQRNLGNTADVNVQRIVISATSTFNTVNVPVHLALGQRLVVRTVSDMTGQVQVSILT